MDAAIGRELRRRREALGLTIGQVADATAIPVDYLVALEAGAPQQLPPGPYGDAYARSYRRLLERAEAQVAVDPDTVPGPPSFGGDTGSFAAADGPGSVPTAEGGEAPANDPVVRTRPVPDRPPRGPWVPLGAMRIIAAVSVASFLGVVSWQVVAHADRWRSLTTSADPEPIAVKVQLRQTARLSIRADGRLVASRRFAGGDTTTYTARDRIEVDVPSVEVVRVWFGDRIVLPRGHQDRPRTLVFVNDEGAP